MIEKNIRSERPRKRTKDQMCNVRDSPAVTNPSTRLTVTGLIMGEQTGSRVLQYLWSYVEEKEDSLYDMNPG